jgi:hypothetical protein
MINLLVKIDSVEDVEGMGTGGVVVIILVVDEDTNGVELLVNGFKFMVELSIKLIE